MLYLEKKWWLFPISVSLIAAYNFVSLYTCSEFLLFYVLFRVLAEEEINFKEIPSLFRNLLLLGLLGVLISAVFSIPNLIAMIDSPRVSGDARLTNEMAAIPIFKPGDSGYLATLLMRTFSSDLLGNGSDYKGWSNYFDAPMSYCGLISLVLVPQLFAFLRDPAKDSLRCFHWHLHFGRNISMVQERLLAIPGRLFQRFFLICFHHFYFIFSIGFG